MSIPATDGKNAPHLGDAAELGSAVGSGFTAELNCLVIGEGDSEDVPFHQAGEKSGIAHSSHIDSDILRLMEAAQKDFRDGHLQEMRGRFEQILALQPDHAQANFNIGIIERDANRLQEAERRMRLALTRDPTNVTFRQGLGDLLLTMRHLLFAASIYEEGLSLAPNNKAMLGNLIFVRQRQRMPDQVIDLSRRYLALDPQSVAAMLSLSCGLLWLGETEEAMDVASRALGFDAQSVAAAATLQVALQRQGRKDAAAAAFADIKVRALASWENCSEAVNTLLQFDEGHLAEDILRSVIDRTPSFVPALLQLGRYKIVSSEQEEGERLMARVAELDPEEGDAQTSVALSKVRNGEYADGWRLHHWRWKRTGCEPRWDLPVAEWDGKAVDDGGLILWREQGIGDMVMYVAPAIACRGLAQPIVIETNIRLRSLLQRSFPDMIVCAREDLPSTFLSDRKIKAHCPIGDLPHLLQLDMEDYPGKDGFLVANPDDVKKLRERYELLFPGKKLIGISWRSGNSGGAILRSIELPHWMPIFETPDCAFISLQYGDVSKDITELRQAHGVDVYVDSVVDPMDDMDIFAAQIAAMDLVVSVDNSTVHVAGALGKMTWALIPAAADWRWLKSERTSSIWYSSLELFRRQPDGDWATEIERVAARLQGLASSDLALQRRDLYLRCAEQSHHFGDLNTAELYYRLILQDEPTHHRALAGLGRIAVGTHHVEDAIGLLQHAVEKAPERSDYWRDYAMALQAGRRTSAAALAIREALARDDRDPASLRLGIEIYRELNNPDEVRNFCARLLRLDPDHREARLELALLQVEDGDFDGAEANFTKVLTAHPEDAVASYSLGCLALRRGDYASGWLGYARRVEISASPLPLITGLADLTEMVLTGGNLQGRHLALRPEATLRDQIMFVRWLKSLRSEVDFIAAEVDPRLIPLLGARMPGIALFPTGSISAEDAADLELTGQAMMGDLGARYGDDAAKLGQGVPYLQFDLDKAASLREDYRAALSCERLIGLSWRGSDIAIPLAEWAPILREAGYGFVALQPGPAQQEIQQVCADLEMQMVRDPSIDAQSNLRLYAAQLAAMDLVIAVDDVPAHLAGALGVKVACVLPQVADWRWLTDDRQDTPWYPSMRLYRQGIGEDWSAVMARVAKDMDGLIERGKGGV